MMDLWFNHYASFRGKDSAMLMYPTVTKGGATIGAEGGGDMNTHPS